MHFKKYPALFAVATGSLRHRYKSVLMTVIAMSVALFTLFTIEHSRQAVRSGFSNSVSGVDLVVGARTSAVNLLLYSVFRIGNASNDIRWSTLQNIASRPDVAWVIPIALGDSHRGFRVVGTDQNYFTHFNYAQQQTLQFAQGRTFQQPFEIVLGAQVANKLGYQLDDAIVLSHGVAASNIAAHKDSPFNVKGILKPTGTPVDNALYVSLQDIERIHKNWRTGVRLPTRATKGDTKPVSDEHIKIKKVTAAYVGLTHKVKTFRVQRWINRYRQEPLTAILPGVALTELWTITRQMEQVLLWLSRLMLVATLFGLSAMLIASMRERQDELRILRVLGARPFDLAAVLIGEALLITLMSLLAANAGLLGVIYSVNTYFAAELGLTLPWEVMSTGWMQTNLVALGLAIIASGLPAIAAYRAKI